MGEEFEESVYLMQIGNGHNSTCIYQKHCNSVIISKNRYKNNRSQLTNAT